MKLTFQCLVSCVLACGLLVSRGSRADEPLPKSLLSSSQASTGSTEVATAGFQKADKPPAASKDATEFEVSAGGLASSGNSRSMAATSASKFRLRRGSDQVGAAIAANYAQSATSRGEGLRTTVQNFQGRLRYDRFLSGSFAVFAAGSARHDRFQGLELRLNFDPGVEYYLVDESAQQLWLEVGYDLQYDVRTDEVRAAALEENVYLGKSVTRHSARVFAGYSNALSDSVTVRTGLEYLQGIAHSTNYRLNWDGSVNAAVGKGFSIATAVSVRYDHNPLPDIEKTDVATSISLVYHLL